MPDAALAVLQWRRETAALYREVRARTDPAAAHELWCRRRSELMRTLDASAGQDLLLRHAPYDEAWRAEVELLRDVASERIEVATGTDGVVPFERIGRVEVAGLSLDVWWLDSYGGGLWLPVRDTSPETYGGGRYVLDTVKGADLGGEAGRLVVDLNFAYNPSCAYDEAWACPLAPPGNRVEVALPVGELLPERG